MRRFVIAAVVALLALVGLAPVARAASVLSGPIEPGTPVTLDLGPDDFADVSFPFPAGATATLTVTAMSPGLAVQVLASNTNAVLAADDPSAWFLELGTNGSGETGETSVFLANASGTAGSVTFVVATPVPREVRVATGADVPVQVDTPGQRVLVTFDAGIGDRSTLRLSDLVLSDALDGGTGPRFVVQPPGYPFAGDRTPEDPGQSYGPHEVQRDGDSSYLLELAGGRTGSFTVHLDLEYAPGLDVFYRSDAHLLTLDTPTRVRQVHFTATGFAATGVQVFDPQLSAAGGAQGSATVQLVLPGSAPVTLGTVTDAPVTFTTPEPLPHLGDATLRVVGDGASTGTLFVRLVLAPVPGPALTPGSTPLTLPAGAGARTWTIDAAEGEDYGVFFQDIAFGDPSSGGTVTATVLDPAGQQQSSTNLTVFSTREQVGFSARTAGRYTVELSWDGPTDFDVTTTALVVRRTERAVTATVPADVPVDLGVGETLAVTLPVREGHRLALRLVDQAWTGPDDQFGNPPDVSVTASSDVLGFDALSPDDFGLSANGDRYLQTLDAPADGTVTVRIAGQGLTTGSARLLVSEPTDTTGPFAPAGSPTTIPVEQPGATAAFSFEVTQPGPVALDIAAPTLSRLGEPGGTAHVTLRLPDGTFATNTFFDGGEGMFLDLGAPDETGIRVAAPGTYTVVLDPLAEATGSIVVTRVTPALVTTRVRAGAVTPLTFGRGDVRRLTFTARAGQRPVVRLGGDALDLDLTLVGPDGRAVANLRSFDYGGSYAEFEPLPVSGTWSLLLDPPAGNAGSATARVDLVRDAVRTAEPGKAVTATWGVGENLVYRFAVRKGQHVAVDVRTAVVADTAPGTGQVSLALFGAGTGDFSLARATLGESAGTAPVWLEPGETGFTAPVDGVWELRLDGFRATTGRVTFVVRTAADKVVTGRLGKTTTVAVDAPVQNVALPFDVSGPAASGLLTWSVTDSTFAGARLQLFTPFGTLWDVVDVPPGSSSGTFFSGLGFTGTWRLVVDPTDGSTGRAKVFFGLTGTT